MSVLQFLRNAAQSEPLSYIVFGFAVLFCSTLLRRLTSEKAPPVAAQGIQPDIRSCRVVSIDEFPQAIAKRSGDAVPQGKAVNF
jgi:hypothetical protein